MLGKEVAAALSRCEFLSASPALVSVVILGSN